MYFSDEQIIAFLLGDADQHLADSLKQALMHDGELVDRVSHFRSVLSHLDLVSQPFEPPDHLIDNTLARIDALARDREISDELDHPDELSLPILRLEPVFSAGSTSTLSLSVENPKVDRNWYDSAVLTISLTVLCCLSIPAVLEARHQSRRAQCAANLRENGLLLFEYADRRGDKRLPYVASAGREAFAGVFVVRLHDVGLAPRFSSLRCVSLMGYGDRTALEIKSNRIPSIVDLNQACESTLEHWKSTLAGDYAYSLGLFEEGQLVAARHSGNTHYAVLADTVQYQDGQDQVVAHDGRGVNLLYDDGHVQFVNSRCLNSVEQTTDHPFRNLIGDHEAGLSMNDASLAPSYFPALSR